MIRYFTAYVEPQGKGRPRATTIGGHARVYTPSNTAKYENLIRLAYQNAYPNASVMHGAVLIEIAFYFKPPKNAYWPVNSKHNGELREGWQMKKHTGKPDLDNLVKSVLDGLNGVAFHDDSQIWSVTSSKMYNDKPCVAVTIYAEDGDGERDTAR